MSQKSIIETPSRVTVLYHLLKSFLSRPFYFLFELQNGGRIKVYLRFSSTKARRHEQIVNFQVGNSSAQDKSTTSKNDGVTKMKLFEGEGNTEMREMNQMILNVTCATVYWKLKMHSV